MGNCLTSDKARPQNEEQLEPEVAEAASRVVEEMKRMREFDDGQKKMVKFRLTTGEVTNSVEREKVGVVRIKVVVTREELKQIWNCDESDLMEQSSVEKLVTAMKLRGRRIYEVSTNDNGDNNSIWRPTLESIPEDHCS